jgi:hypothetical protein
MSRNIYCYPKIGRAGLGNCLLVWARAFVCSKQNGFRMLAPQWVQPRLGAVLRREPVTRFYTAEFTNRGYVGGLRKWWILQRGERISESALSNFRPDSSNANNQMRVIEFDGLADYFTGLVPCKESIFSELKHITHPQALRGSGEVKAPFIAVNIRRGDMTRQNKIPLDKILQYTPDEWFMAAIKALRAESKWKDAPIKIVSDGSRDELRDILRLPGCELVTTGKAVGDILLMAKASLLLATGYSTFSMWASFLGEMPTLYAPGKMQQKLFRSESKSFEGEWNPGQPLYKTIVE